MQLLRLWSMPLAALAMCVAGCCRRPRLSSRYERVAVATAHDDDSGHQEDEYDEEADDYDSEEEVEEEEWRRYGQRRRRQRPPPARVVAGSRASSQHQHDASPSRAESRAAGAAAVLGMLDLQEAPAAAADDADATGTEADEPPSAVDPATVLGFLGLQAMRAEEEEEPAAAKEGPPEGPQPAAQSCRAPLKLSALAARADTHAQPAEAAPTVVLGLADVTLGSAARPGPAKRPSGSNRVSRVRYVLRGVS